MNEARQRLLARLLEGVPEAARHFAREVAKGRDEAYGREHLELRSRYGRLAYDEAFLFGEAEERLKRVIQEPVQKVESDGRIRLWRALSGDEDLPEEMAESGTVGRHWSFVREQAFPHWGAGERYEFLVEALADSDDVDVEATLSSLVCDIPEEHATNECEVALDRSAKVEVESTHWRKGGELFTLTDPDAWEPVPHDPLAGATLTAGERAPAMAPT